MGWLSLLKKFGPYILIALLSILFLRVSDRADHWHGQTLLCQAQRKEDKANYEAAQNKAADMNKAVVLEQQKKWQAAADKQNEEYDAKIATANTAVAAYVDRMRKQGSAAKGSTGSTSVSSTAPASGTPEGAGEDSVIPVLVDDLNICAENTEKAKSWQVFYGDLLK